MNAWNSVIYVKSNKSISQMNAMAKWDGVEKMWSTTGEWDWCIKLDQHSSSPENAEAFVEKIRQGQLATETETNWWKEVAAK